MKTFFLILTFWSGGSPSTAILPKTYNSIETCKQAGEDAVLNYTGGATVNYTCVESQ
jgi:hypothetical protein